MTKIETEAKKEIYIISAFGDHFQVVEYSENYKAHTYSSILDKYTALYVLTSRRSQYCENKGQFQNYFRKLLNKGSTCRESARDE